MNTLEQLREKIDRIDEQIIALIAQRFSAIKQVAEEKKKIKKEIFDAEREQSILDKVRHVAKEQDLSPLIAEEIFKYILQESKTSQDSHMR